MIRTLMFEVGGVIARAIAIAALINVAAWVVVETAGHSQCAELAR